MRLLLDTHAFIWWLAGDAALSAPVQQAIGNEANAIFVSAASAGKSRPSTGSASCPRRPSWWPTSAE